MKIAELMTTDVRTCSPDDTLERAAQIMSEKDCGVVPVADEEGHTVGVVTDRDICMAAFTHDRPLSEIAVSDAASKTLVCASPDETIEAVEALMQSAQIRRIPIVDAERRSVGIVSVGDIARRFSSGPSEDVRADAVARTLAAISQPRTMGVESEQAIEVEGAAAPMSGAPSPTVSGPAASPSPVYRVKSMNGGWEVYDRDGNPVSDMFMAQSDAVVHAKELAHRDGSAQIIVHAKDGSIVSEFFYQRDERSSLSFDDSLRTFAASRPARSRRRTGPPSSPNR